MPALLLAIFVQQRSAPPYKRDQTLLIEMQEALRNARLALPEPTPLPLDERLSGTDRLYLFTSAMGQHKDGRATQLLQPAFENSLQAAKEGMPASLIPRIIPAWTGQVIHLGAIPQRRPLIFFGRWGDTGVNGRNIHPPAAHLAFHSTESLSYRRLCLRVTPATQRDLYSTFAIRGVELKMERLKPGDTRVIELSLPKGDIVLSILIGSDTARAAKGENPALTLQRVWLADRCF